MTKASDFVKALQAAGHHGADTVDDARNREKREWVRDLDDLRAMIRQWLEPVVAAKLAAVVDRDFSLAEPELGQYVAPGLEITVVVKGPRTVLIHPRGVRIVGRVEPGGRRLFGGRGRVDVECGLEREVLLRFKDAERAKWVSFSRGEPHDLGEDLFFELLARVTELNLR